MKNTKTYKLKKILCKFCYELVCLFHVFVVCAKWKRRKTAECVIPSSGVCVRASTRRGARNRHSSPRLKVKPPSCVVGELSPLFCAHNSIEALKNSFAMRCRRQKRILMRKSFLEFSARFTFAVEKKKQLAHKSTKQILAHTKRDYLIFIANEWHWMTCRNWGGS